MESMEGVFCVFSRLIWVFPTIGVPQNGWFLMEIPIKLDDLGVPPFSETSIFCHFQLLLGFAFIFVFLATSQAISRDDRE